MLALRRHGELRLRPIEIENIRTEIYTAAMSISTALAGKQSRRYQALKIAVEPVIVVVKAMPIIDEMMVEAMPIIV